MKRECALIRAVLLALVLVASKGFAQDTSSAERYAEAGQAALAAGRYDDAENAFDPTNVLRPNQKIEPTAPAQR